HLLRALVLPGHDRRQGAAGVGLPREYGLALVVEPARGDRAAGTGENLAHCADHRVEHLGRVLLDPARLGISEAVLATRLRERARSRVVQTRLYRGGPLVDPEQQRHAATDARYSAVRRHQGRSKRGDGPPLSGASGPSATPSEPTIDATY